MGEHQHGETLFLAGYTYTEKYRGNTQTGEYRDGETSGRGNVLHLWPTCPGSQGPANCTSQFEFKQAQLQLQNGQTPLFPFICDWQSWRFFRKQCHAGLLAGGSSNSSRFLFRSRLIVYLDRCTSTQSARFIAPSV